MFIVFLAFLTCQGCGRRVQVRSVPLHTSPWRVSTTREWRQWQSPWTFEVPDPARLLTMLLLALPTVAGLQVTACHRTASKSAGGKCARLAPQKQARLAHENSKLLSRRGVLGSAGLFLISAAHQPSHAYDEMPKAPSIQEMRKKYQEQAVKVDALNAKAESILAKVRAAKDAEQFDTAMAELTIWIIGTGKPVENDFIEEYPLPKGFKTRELVNGVQEAKRALPRVVQQAGQVIPGLPSCPKTRDMTPCLSAGPLAEAAYQAMMVELEQRAARQYDEPGASASYKVWLSSEGY